MFTHPIYWASCNFDRHDIRPDLCGHDSFKGCKVANSLHKNDQTPPNYPEPAKVSKGCRRIEHIFIASDSNPLCGLWFWRTSCKKYPQWHLISKIYTEAEN